MKTLLTLTVLCLTLIVSAKELKVLMIGNSFSQSVLSYLPAIAKADPENKLILANAFIGGCTLKRHVDNIKKETENPNFKPYVSSYPIKNPGKKNRANIKDLLTAEAKWDIISIQQGSPSSWKEADTEPYASELIAYIRKFQPEAEIVIQQTWSYRCDSPAFARWKIDQNKMYELLDKNYRALAERNNFRIIPVGFAVQIARKHIKNPYRAPTPEELAALTHPNVLSTGDDVVGLPWVWHRNKKTNELKYIIRDVIHLNNYGKYLQACVWYMFLFDKTAKDIPVFQKNKYLPDTEYQKALALYAEEAVKTYVQVKK